MKKKKLIKIISIALATLVIFSGVKVTYSWLSGSKEVKFDDIQGSIIEQYFHCGTGTKEDPFVITRPVHYYNLVNLYQRLDGFDNEEYFFQLGYDLDNDGDLEVFNYDDSGKRNTSSLYSNSLNLAVYSGENALLPIGTSEKPFVSHFNGNRLTIANLNVKCSETYNSTESASTADVGVFGYVSIPYDTESVEEPEPYIKDIYFENLTIDVTGINVDKISTENKDNYDAEVEYHSNNYCYVGYLAGHTETWKVFSNIYMNNASIIDNKSTGTTLNIQNNYGYFGFCADASDLEDMVMKVKGSEIGWGGSIGMDELYNRIDSFRSSAERVTVENSGYHYFNNGVEDTSKTRTTTTSLDSYEYFNNDLTGRVVYYSPTENNAYLFGVRNHNYTYTTTNEIHTDDDPVYYYIKSGNYYLRLAGGNADRTTNENNLTKLFVDDNGWVYYRYSDNNYYLYSDVTDNKGNYTYGETLKSSKTMQNYMFKVDGTTLSLYRRSDGTAQNRYVRYNNSSPYFRVGTTSTNITQTTDYKTEVKTETITHYTNGSYLPLNVYKSEDEITEDVLAALPEAVVNGARLNNTGYIVGGTKDMTRQYNSAVRVAQNYDYGHISRALGGSSTYSGKNLQILTRTKDSNGVTFINDSYNDGVKLSTNLTNLTYVNNANKKKVDVDVLGLKSYNAARYNLDVQFKANTTKLYVMRFNEFQISLENKIVAEKVLLNGEIKTNYELPESCIDFNLKEKGYISFFGGGFRGGSCNAFFSLYHVVRDNNDKITALKHLSKIYGTDSTRKPYVYEYDDGTYSIYQKNETTKKKEYQSITSIPEGYSEYFDLNWVEAPGFTAVDNTMWYFEIPVNEGEYALGAVDGRTGAYMMYLDVGANGGGIENVENFTNIDYKDSPYTYTPTEEEPELVSPLLFSYDAEEGTKVNVNVTFESDETGDFENGIYTITVSADKEILLLVALLGDDIKVVIMSNGKTLDTIEKKDFVTVEVGGN